MAQQLSAVAGRPKLAAAAACPRKVVELLSAPKLAPRRGQSSAESDVLANPVQFVGGNSGTQKSVKAWQDGKRVTRLRVYSGEYTIKAIRLWLSDDDEGNYRQFGEPDGKKYEEFTFEDGERVQQMSLWGNGEGTRAGWISFSTNKGKSFSYGMYGRERQTEYEVNVGSGILVGALYNYGSDIDAHGYYFLRASVASTQVSDVTYPTLQWDTQSINPVALDTYNQTNNSSSPINWRFSGSQTLTQSSSWGMSMETTFNVNTSLQASVPEVVKIDQSFGWRRSESGSHQTSEESKHDVQWENSGQLQPGESISLVALTRRGDLNVPYNSTAIVTLKNNATFSFPQSGTYKGISFTSVDVQDNPQNKYRRAAVVIGAAPAPAPKKK